jgi:hypothetical protein
LVVKDGYDDPYQLPRHLVNELQKTKIFQVCFGTVLANKKRCDVVVCSVFEDGSPIEIHGQTSG